MSWAYESVQAAIADDPAGACEVIVDLVAMAPDAEALAYVGAGPLEDLLHDHGPELITAVENIARRDPRFRAALNNVYLDELDTDVCARIRKVTAQGRQP